MRKMKLLLSAAVFVAAGAFTPVRAQFNGDPNVNTVVRDFPGMNSGVSRIATAPNGKSFVVWRQTNGSLAPQVRMQLIDSNGVRQWDSAGIIIDTLLGSASYVDQLVVDKKGDALYTLTDQRNPGTFKNRAVIYKIDQQGNSLWGTNGIVLYDTTTNPYYSYAGSICVTDSNNVIVAYTSDPNTRTFTTFEKYSPSGVMLWDTKKRLINLAGNPHVERPQMVSAGGENFNMIFVQKTQPAGFGQPALSTIYAQQFDGSGAAVWPALVRVSNKTIGAAFPSVSTDGYGGAFVTFTSSKPLPLSQTLQAAYGQRVYADGHLWDTTGKQLMVDNGIVLTTQYDYGNVFARQSNSYFGYMQLQDGATPSVHAVGMQKLDTAGNRLFDSISGLVLAPMNTGANVPNPVSLKLMDSSLVAVYTTGPNTSSPFIMKIMAKKVDFSGANLWASGPVAISTASSNKGKMMAGDYSHNQIVVSWNDSRATAAPTGPSYPGGVYVQNIRFDSLRGVICPTVTMDTIASMLPDAAPLTLTAGHPAGGTYYGTGVTNGVFDPAVSGLGTFTITYVYSVNPCLDSATTTVTVKCPAVSMDALDTILRNHGPLTLTGGHPAGGTYSGTGVTNGVFDPLEAGAGTFTITYHYDVPPCHDSAMTTITVLQPSGIRDIEARNLFECYPNPANGQFLVTLKQNVTGNVTVRVTGVDGREIMSDSRYSNGKYSHSFDLSHVANGIYIVEVKTPAGTASAKLIKQ